MFYCNPCAKTCGWPTTSARWRGRCEMCKRFDESLSDLPSSLLPRPIEIPERDAATQSDKEG